MFHSLFLLFLVSFHDSNQHWPRYISGQRSFVCLNLLSLINWYVRENMRNFTNSDSSPAQLSISWVLVIGDTFRWVVHCLCIFTFSPLWDKSLCPTPPPPPGASGLFPLPMMLCCRVRALRPLLLPWKTQAAAASGTFPGKQSNHPSVALSFDDPSAFRVKSFSELLRSLGVFCFCSFPMLVNNCGKVRDMGDTMCMHVYQSDTEACV